MPLSHNEIAVLTVYEESWYLEEKLPSLDTVVRKSRLPRADVRAILASENFEEACRNRGISVSLDSESLTPIQLALANTLLDFSDMATPAQKLRRLGVNPRQYSAWMKQKAFKAYMLKRSEGLFADALPEAHAALARNIQNGDLSSIKLFYEISGRWSSKTAGEVNIDFLMMKILDVLFRHISDPDTLRLIADELGQLTGASAKQIQPSPVVTGELL